jgi:uncharacterized protein
MVQERHVEALSPVRCEEKLRSVQIGRVVTTDSALPTAIPVTFVVANGDVVFRADASLKFDLSARGTVIAFQADSYDADLHTGWTVIATGIARVVQDPDELDALDIIRIPSWVADEDPMYVRLSIGSLTGQQIHPLPRGR